MALILPDYILYTEHHVYGGRMSTANNRMAIRTLCSPNIGAIRPETLKILNSLSYFLQERFCQ